ncbi:MAG: diaminopimelate decarboxylase [Gemmatimonadaceae bacterium]
MRRGLAGRGALGESVLSTGFGRVDGTLHCDGVPLDVLAARVGTPSYVYSAQSIREQYTRLSEAFSGTPHRLHYSVKANSSLAILAILRELGAGLDIVSGGELFRALKAGYAGSGIVFSGVGKTEAEIEEALAADVLLINIESEEELRLVNEVAGRMRLRARIALRINPGVTVDTPHPYTRTGEKGMKFGIPHDEALRVASVALGLKNVLLAGLDMHVGSQISLFGPYEMGLQRLLVLLEQMRATGASDIRYIDIGGGLAVTYDTERPIDVTQLGTRVSAMLAGLRLELIVEPGRFIVGNAGVLLTRVLYRKRSGGKEYVITDAGMNDLLRPSHYNAYHRIESVASVAGRIVADVVGPVCESGDFFALNREMDDVSAGDILAVHSAGAYGFVMASQYNSRPKAAEVMVDGDRYGVVTERESYDDLVKGEHVVPRWSTL